MTDRIALLRAIQANPADDLPRLVYADWLDDHGTTDADKARSEFIRLGCKMKAKTAISPTETKWLETNWPRLIPATLDAMPELKAGRLVREGRLIGLIPQGFETWKKVFKGQSWLCLSYFRGFANAITFKDGTVYSKCRSVLADEEPLAEYAPYQGMKLEEEIGLSYASHYQVTLKPETWGEDVFERMSDFDEQVKETKRYRCRPIPKVAHMMRSGAYRLQREVTKAMTAIARESNGLTT